MEAFAEFMRSVRMTNNFEKIVINSLLFLLKDEHGICCIRTGSEYFRSFHSESPEVINILEKILDPNGFIIGTECRILGLIDSVTLARTLSLNFPNSEKENTSC